MSKVRIRIYVQDFLNLRDRLRVITAQWTGFEPGISRSSTWYEFEYWDADVPLEDTVALRLLNVRFERVVGRAPRGRRKKRKFLEMFYNMYP